MRKIINKFILILLVGFIAVIAVKVTPIVISGYTMYKEAISQSSISEEVSILKSRSTYVEIDEISQEYIDTLLKSEDKRFYSHMGFDPVAIMRAMVSNIELGYFAQGGSTITQQLAKNLYFTFEKDMDRKVAELLVAFDLERMYTKDEILELYVNIAYYGEGCDGLKMASQHYYGVNPEELSKEQCSALVMTLKSPNYYNPNVASEGSKLN